MVHPRPLLHLYFQTNITIFMTNKCEKCPSSKRSWDYNTQPLEHESPPITASPGLSFSASYFPHKLIIIELSICCLSP